MKAFPLIWAFFFLNASSAFSGTDLLRFDPETLVKAGFLGGESVELCTHAQECERGVRWYQEKSFAITSNAPILKIDIRTRDARHAVRGNGGHFFSATTLMFRNSIDKDNFYRFAQKNNLIFEYDQTDRATLFDLGDVAAVSLCDFFKEYNFNTTNFLGALRKALGFYEGHLSEALISKYSEINRKHNFTDQDINYFMNFFIRSTFLRFTSERFLVRINNNPDAVHDTSELLQAYSTDHQRFINYLRTENSHLAAELLAQIYTINVPYFIRQSFINF